MSNHDGPPGGLTDLPEKMRIHALAKLLGRSSREIVAALDGLGVEVKSAQSSIDRKIAEQVVTALVTDVAAESPAAPAAEEDEVPLSFSLEPEQLAPRPAAALAPVFAPPVPVFQAPTRPAPARREEPVDEAPSSTSDDVSDAGEDTAATTAREPARPPRRSRSRSRAVEEPADDTPADTTDTDTAAGESDDPDESDEDGAARRRRRRGRRGRGRGRGVDDDGTDESDDDATGDDATGSGADTPDGGPAGEPGPADDQDRSEKDGSEKDGSEKDGSEKDGGDGGDEDTDDGEDADGSSRRRRRRRRRKGSGDDTDTADTSDDDPPATVTRVRQPRRSSSADVADPADGDGVQSVRGSTRLEAKRQRRRDGRDAGRRRVPVLSEAEFLARREAVDRTMVVRERGDRMEIAVLEDEVLVEHFVAGVSPADQSMVGNIYLGRVQNVLPSMEAAFVDIGRGRNAVLYAGEVDWDAAGLGGKARRIEQALSSGDPVLVQVTKDPVGHKGARLTTQISLAGRFLVYVPSGGAAGISRKLPDVERKRLKDMLKGIVPSEAGVIIRTASEGVSQEALERDVRRLQAQWDVVKERSEKTGPDKPKAPVLLYEEPDLLVKVVRDQFNEDFTRLVVQGDDAWDTLHNYLGHVAPELGDRIHRHVGTADVFTEHRIDEQLLKALDRKVWLPSGGTLVIDRTEAMTVIDVNTGKYTGSGGNLEETVTRNNLESAEEIVRQLRLRDIGGIIVIDFIDMVLEANRDLVLRRLTECLARDRTRHQVAEVTSLGLVQMTRKRVGGGLLEHFSTPCEHCRGRGVIVSSEPVDHAPEPGRGSDGRGSDSRGSDSRGSDSRSSDGRGPDNRGSDGRGSDGRSSDGRGADGGSRRSRGGRGGRRGDGEPDRNGAGPDNGSNGVAVPTPGPAAIPAPAIPLPAAPVGVVDAGPVADPQGSTSPILETPSAGTVMETGPAAVVERPDTAEVLPAHEATVEELADAAPPDGRPARRRGRVTRTAGAPTVTDPDGPAVTVVTVPVVTPVERSSEASPPETTPSETTEAAQPVTVPAQPEPAAATTRPRRARRTASRPAGPPVAEPGTDPV